MRPELAFNPIRALESAWKILMKAPLPMWVGGLILVAVHGVSGMGGNFHTDFEVHHGAEALLALLVPLVMLGLLIALVMSLVASWLAVGYYNGVATVMRTGDVEFEKLFDARGRWISMFFTRLLQGFISVVSMAFLAIGPLAGVIVHEALGVDEGVGVAVGVLGLLVCVPFTVYVMLGVMLAPYAAALEDVNPFEAIARSWTLANGNRWMLIAFVVITVLMALVGLLMCCVGVLPASILIEVMWVEAYVQATQVDNYDEWWIRSVNKPRRSVPPTALAQVDGGLPEEPAPAEPKSAPSDASPDAGVGGPFDPGGWRDQADIPPIEEDDEWPSR